MTETLFVERSFELNGGELLVRFYLPEKASGGEYQCRYAIGWPGQEIISYSRGLDGIQALMLAMRTVHSELVETDEFQAGRLTWCNQDDLDLPPTWGDGSLYRIPPRQ